MVFSCFRVAGVERIAFSLGYCKHVPVILKFPYRTERRIKTLEKKKTVKIIGTPSRYIQGDGALDALADIIQGLGEHPVFISGRTGSGLIEKRVAPGLLERGIRPYFVPFGKECSREEIERISEICREASCDVIIGVGGGKVLDTAKGVTFSIPAPIILVPTIASNDGPTSCRVITYTETGDRGEVMVMPFNPHIILVDTGVIARAPVRYLAAGMGDALATKFEADQSHASGSLNLFGGRPLHTALMMADTCYTIIREHGVAAIEAVNKRTVTESLELLVEANIYLSGIGFESVGLAASHAVPKGLALIEEMHGALHGEEVAFGVLVQLVLENRSDGFLEDLIRFYRKVGLPCTFEDLGLKHPTPKHMEIIARRTCAKGSHIYRMYTPVTERNVVEALGHVDALGKKYPVRP